jgi:FkbM family methyltransferase
MKTFEIQLRQKIESSIYNDYGTENFDSYRFGEFQKNEKSDSRQKFKNFIKKLINYRSKEIGVNYLQQLEYKTELGWLWNNLNFSDRELLVELMAYRLLGYQKVKLSRNNNEYHKILSIANLLADFNDSIDPKFMHFMLYKMDLNSLGKNIKFYFSPIGVAIDFMLEQYAYSENKKNIIEANLGDTVLDVGGCWGDTALYFADKVGENGKVYSFEFIPNNISIFNKNLSLNPNLNFVIDLIEHPVSDKSGDIIFFCDNGPGSKIKNEPFESQTGTAETISIDDFVDKFDLKSVDFIKMDIEGAEPIALNGAIKTIKKFRPKLAIAIYHSMSDFVNIPKWIIDLDLGYEIFLDHYTIHSEETVIYAKIKS